MFFNVINNSSISDSGREFGPSLKASFGLGCVSIKIPDTPTANAALASGCINSLCPPEDSTLAPGS